MNNDWLGKTVSLNCGSLGFFQGVIQGVHLDQQTITIKNFLNNGVPSKIASITLRGQDICDLEFLESSEKSAPDARSTVQVKKRQRPVAENLASTSAAAVAATAAAVSNITIGSGKSSAFTQSPQRTTPRKNLSNPEFHRATPPRDSQRTPNLRMRMQRKNEDCFGEEMYHEDFSKEFDFEKNLALFDKRSVFEEITAANQPDVVRLVDINRRKPDWSGAENTEPKYRNDQNVLDAAPVSLRQISTGTEHLGEYSTDTGLVVPSIDLALRKRLMAAAEARGISFERITELMARSGTELSIQLLGGARRLTPANSHQFPVAVILAGTGRTGAYGLAIARHLASQGVRTVAYLPEMQVYLPAVAAELNLYKLCCKSGTETSFLTSEVKDLPKALVDLVVFAMDDHETYVQESRQAWHKAASSWTSGCRAPILAVDPVPGSPVTAQAKASLLPGLPLWHAHNTAGMVFLVNLALPAKVFKDVGVAFASPFGAKTYIGLHSSD